MARLLFSGSGRQCNVVLNRATNVHLRSDKPGVRPPEMLRSYPTVGFNGDIYRFSVADTLHRDAELKKGGVASHAL